MQFGADIAARHGFDAVWVRDALAQARMVPSVARFIMPPPSGTPKNWAAYRARFVEPTRIRAGAAFWRANEKWLAQAEETFGVPAEIVVGIVGVETIYGQQMGNFRLVDALSTLAFDFPTGRKDRSAFFRDELEALFVLCRSEGIDPLALKGSYAGAFGMPQFMPSSFNRYAVDLDGDGHVDLHRNPGRRDRQRRELPRDVRLEDRAADPLRGRAADRPGGEGAPARARHRSRVQRRPSSRRPARASATPASRPTASSRWSSSRTATARRATWPARPTSTRSRATTGRATTRSR